MKRRSYGILATSGLVLGAYVSQLFSELPRNLDPLILSGADFIAGLLLLGGLYCAALFIFYRKLVIEYNQKRDEWWRQITSRK